MIWPDLPACGFWCHLPTVRIGQAAPLIHLLPQLIDDGRGIILLRLGGKPLALVENYLLLLGCWRFAFARFWDRGDELGAAAALKNLLRGLAVGVQFPMPRRAFIRGIENRLFKKGVRHFQFLFSWPMGMHI
jgi:hypothetical protein